ncbi:cysteine desulfuration protein SufE [Chitinophaga ginsengisegetis]|jgi:cysteine desulfuration protein SufE|uniref:Cysteine desulfuration protein SufE n=1 Tax=Chitinophaga ginsengisegetis TaxID=393003 RepID=A0A1T5N4N1_9BACT|nr:SufE family protein [Chitinophaga ginsengisegetis]MDR6571218.1 cysteine desulfuration protein SufE [Chitinophaga ginsengisegetis]MDR6650944.1 cysteine desulfuration protein SufE [Chitinophaga ginsengisegetis]MDR6657302.1 cysteine desulfuration protein SufE [Chitinophaga ginsengisegetis]SKC95441.1 cysteine desulfuration protein SufE [Chitinophaga ginsengisegetis]
MTIQEIQEEIISDFSVMGSWEDKYEYIIQLGKELPLISEEFKTPDNLIKGCQSRVWLHTELKDGKLFFTGDSDAVITKGLVSLMIYVLSGHTPQEIAAAEIYFIDAIGLSSHLSPTRSNGLLSMLKQMKLYAIAYQAKINQQ